MAQMANWNGHTFEVSPNLIRGFSDLSIKGSCETTTKNSDKQKYVKRKYGEVPEISFVVILNAFFGVTSVYDEAMTFITEAQAGTTAYFYLGTSKLIPAKLMLTSAEVTEIVNMPGQGDTWISCKIKLTFKQGDKTDKAEKTKSSSSGSKSKKSSKNKSGTQKSDSDKDDGVDAITGAAPKAVNDAAKAASKDSKKTKSGVDTQGTLIVRNTTTTNDSNTKVSPTTGRTISGGS